MLALNVLKQKISKYKDIVLISIIALFFAYTATLRYTNNRLKAEVETNVNNIEAYQGLLQRSYTDNNVLKLDITTLRYSKDSLLQQIDSVKNKLKISDKNLKLAMASNSTIDVHEKDTVLLKDSCQFSKVFKPNDLTSIKIQLVKDSISYDLNIENTQFLLVDIDKDWKNKNKTFFKRLFSWDFKKILYTKYLIRNTNPIIKVGDTRVIENINSK